MSAAIPLILKYLSGLFLYGMLFALVVMKATDASILIGLIIAGLSTLGVHASAALSSKISNGKAPTP
jgi:hypothetical protein